MMNYEQTVKSWLRAGVAPLIPRDRSDAEPCTVSECLLFRPDAPHPRWQDLQEVESWLGRPEAVRAVGKIVADVLNEAGATLKSFNTEFERRIDEYRLPVIDETGLHPAVSHRQDVQLSCALEAAAAIIHGRTAA